MNGTRRSAVALAKVWCLLTLVAWAVWGPAPLPLWFTLVWYAVAVAALSCVLSWRWLARVNRRTDRLLAEPLTEHVPGMAVHHLLPGQVCTGCAPTLAHQAPAVQVLKLSGTLAHPVLPVPSPSGAALYTMRHPDGSPCSAECQARGQW